MVKRFAHASLPAPVCNAHQVRPHTQQRRAATDAPELGPSAGDVLCRMSLDAPAAVRAAEIGFTAQHNMRTDRIAHVQLAMHDERCPVLFDGSALLVHQACLAVVWLELGHEHCVGAVDLVVTAATGRGGVRATIEDRVRPPAEPEEPHVLGAVHHCADPPMINPRRRLGERARRRTVDGSEAVDRRRGTVRERATVRVTRNTDRARVAAQHARVHQVERRRAAASERLWVAMHRLMHQVEALQALRATQCLQAR